MSDEHIKRLNRIRDLLGEFCNTDYAEDIAALDAARAALGGGWIEISDGKPKVGQIVAVHTPGAMMSDIWPALWNGSFFDAGGGWFETEEVLRWAPLPPLPAPPSKEG